MCLLATQMVLYCRNIACLNLCSRYILNMVIGFNPPQLLGKNKERQIGLSARGQGTGVGNI
jgi:hypothetical protein